MRIELKYGGLKFLGSYKMRSCSCQNPNLPLHRNLILAGISQFGVGPSVILVHGDYEIPIYKMFRVSTGTGLLAPPPSPSQFKVHTLFARSLSSLRWKTLLSLLDSLLSAAYLADNKKKSERSSCHSEAYLKVWKRNITLADFLCNTAHYVSSTLGTVKWTFDQNVWNCKGLFPGSAGKLYGLKLI
jgi:hypothetical protein